MEMAGEILGQLLAACVGTAAFSALFGVPKKYWLDCGICGAVGWGVYLAVMAAYQTPIIGTFAASAVLTMLSRCLAVQRKAPIINALTGKIGRLAGVSAKTVYSKA